MSCNTKNLGLIVDFQIEFSLQKLSYFSSCFDSIHHRHAEIHEYHRVRDAIFVSLHQCIYCFLAIEAEIDVVFDIDSELNTHLPHWSHAELFIIDYHDPHCFPLDGLFQLLLFLPDLIKYVYSMTAALVDAPCVLCTLRRYLR